MFNRFQLSFILSVLWLSAFGQVKEKGQPASFLPENQVLFASKNSPISVVPAPDMKKIREEDDAQPFQTRFAAPVLTSVSPENSGQWFDLPSGDRIWQCTINSPGAKGLVLIFDEFKIPAGGRFFVFDSEKRLVDGAYTSKSCSPENNLVLGPFPGETVVLEYFEPFSTKNQAQIRLNRVDYAYNEGAMAEVAGLLGFGNSLPNCHTNINCQLAFNYFIEKRGIARILMVFGTGSGWCSGSLIANTKETPEPFFLTAQHCQQIGSNPNFNNWRFDFNYELPGCQNSTTEPEYVSVLGCQKLAARSETDFMLLKLNPLPNAVLYFNGWDRKVDPPGYTALVHHPQGDVKKFTTDADPAEVYENTINWGGVFGTSPINTHYRTQPETGTFEPGSSGCPLFDENRRIVGQLHGGTWVNNNKCYPKDVYFGIFNRSWNDGGAPATRLKDWLDSLGTNKIVQEGYLQPLPPPPPLFSISGNVKTFWGAAIPGVRLKLVSNIIVRDTFADANGNYVFPDLQGGFDYILTVERDTNPLNGVTVIDLGMISKHILGVAPFDSFWKYIAADANSSGTISTFDIFEFKKSILGVYPDGVPLLPSWRFFPADTQFSTPPFPLPVSSRTFTNLQDNFTNINFLGIKTGDLNQSASPGQ